jgi:hypothetical protein
MGTAIRRETFTALEHERFSARLVESLSALAALLARPGFGVGPRSVGAELELHLVDAAGRPLPINQRVLGCTADPRVVPELGGFNLECNPRPTLLTSRPFQWLASELQSALAEARRAAVAAGARVVAIGVLPTLGQQDLGPGAITRLPRYRALSRGLRGHRSGPFLLHISGKDTLQLASEDVSPAGASTSLQFHLRVDPADFTRVFNAAQLATAPVLALSGNSPLFLGRRLWHETRIALYGQSMDDRSEEEQASGRPARVGFGQRWLSGGALDLFTESVTLHPPILPVLSDELPLEVVRSGGVPKLQELLLHHGTVYPWNRAVYDPHGEGHLRIEMRALPAGPSLVDMLANGAFLLGLVLALEHDMSALLPHMDFQSARGNFFAAAHDGLEATLRWPSKDSPSPRPVPVRKLLPRLLRQARTALVAAGVASEDVDGLFDILSERLGTGHTGALWQLETLAQLEERQPREDALAQMLERYMEYSESGAPVHTWPVH